jgi:hypothetical protein
MGITQQIGASSIIKPGVIDNAAARPASPFEGQTIFQKDTDQLLIWDGTAWYPPKNTAWGLITLTTDQTIQSSIGTTETVTLTTSSFTAVANRYYRITYYEPVLQASTVSPGYITARIRLTNVSGTVYQYADMEPVVSSTSDGQISTLIAITTLTAGSTVFVGTLKTSSNTVTAYGSTGLPVSRYLMVEDIGPA